MRLDLSQEMRASSCETKAWCVPESKDCLKLSKFVTEVMCELWEALISTWCCGLVIMFWTNVINAQTQDNRQRSQFFKIFI